MGQPQTAPAPQAGRAPRRRAQHKTLTDSMTLEDAELSPEKKYDWLMRILKLQQALMAAQSSIVTTEALIGGGDRTMILGLSMGGMPATGGGDASSAGGVDIEDISSADLRRRALEVAGFMEDLDRVPPGIESAIEAEVAAEG